MFIFFLKSKIIKKIHDIVTEMSGMAGPVINVKGIRDINTNGKIKNFSLKSNILISIIYF